MMKKQSLALCLSAFLLVTFSFYACKKDSKSADTDTTSAQDNSYAEGSYNDVNTMVDASASAGTSANGSFRMETNDANARVEGPFSGCGTVTVDTSSTIRTITINFGTTNGVCLDGRSRRGKIIATYTGRYRDSGTVINVTFDGYYVDDNNIKGTHKTTNLGRNAAGHLVYKVEVAGTIVKANNGGTITWNSTRQREWLTGADTPLNPLDDSYSITGSANGTTAAGESYTINITQALIRKLTCQWFESGKVDITPSGKATRTLDYGTTGCDANATVTISGVTFPVVLK
jgi:hypothetical protein